MTDQDKRALSERIATLAEQAGLPNVLLWEEAAGCDQGHEQLPRMTGQPCWICGEVLPRVSRDLTDPASLLAVVEAWRQQRPLRSWRMTSRLDAEIKCHAYAGVSEVPDGFIKVETLRNGSTPWVALALAFAAALEQEKGADA